MNQPNLSDLQLAVIHVLWERGEATAAQVREALKPHRKLAMSTVSTVLSRLEDKGVLTHRREGRGFVYRPTVTQRNVQRSMVADMIEKVFKGDAGALVSHLLRESEIDAEELARLQDLVDNMNEEDDDDG